MVGFFRVLVRFQEPGQAMEIAFRFDVPHHGHEGRLVDQRLERHVVQVELAADRHHDAVVSCSTRAR